MNITIVAGARPNFMKIAPIIEAIEVYKQDGFNINYRLVHTGQHYDKKMSGDFFEQLGIPEPHVNLSAGSGTQAEQSASIMVKFELELISNPCDLVIVVGDVTSTMACAITTKKLNIQLAHVEGGIRSNDWRMPEEINRIVTDSISDYFFTTSRSANENLLKLGFKESQIRFVGNTMIDTLLKQTPFFKAPVVFKDYELVEKKYIVITLHRPSNVDDKKHLYELLSQIANTANDIPIVFPVHPRTLKNIKEFNISFNNLILIDPLSYLEFNYLVKNSMAVITDSGGITEETTVMGVPCITLRENTERPETCLIGTNELIGTDPNNIPFYINKLLEGDWKNGRIPELWDGNAAGRIVKDIIELYNISRN